MSDDEIILHHSILSRSVTAVWLLEELGVPYRRIDWDIRTGQNRAPDFLALNPRGTVPTLQIGEMVVTELPAICTYVADRYSYGDLAPRIEAADRGPYLQWMAYSTAVLEPAVALGEATIEFPNGEPPWGPSWHTRDDAVRFLSQTLADRDYLLGERFSAADVMLGSMVAIRLFTKMLPPDPVLVTYNDRLLARPAFQRAQAINWPPELFPPR